MAKDKSVLVVRVNAEGTEHSFDLIEGKKLIIGRAPDCQLCLAAANISSEHLEIFYSEGQVRVKDLTSANGTFRLPSKAPFVEAVFRNKNESLELLLAKTPVKIFWNTQGESFETNVEKTIPLIPSQVEKPKPSVPISSQKPKKEIKAPVKRVAPILVAPEEEKKATLLPRQTSLVASKSITDALKSWFPAGLTVVLAWVGILWLKSRGLDALLLYESSHLPQGMAWDEFVVWFWALKEDGWILIPLCLSGTAIGNLILKKYSWSSKISATSPSQKLLLSFAVVAFLVLFPWIRLMASGLGPAQWPDLIRLTQLFENPSVSAKLKHNASKNLLPRFRGSSYFYVKRFQVQTKRVLEECNGAGEKPWENKKVCLLLLHAVGVENLEEFSPIILKETAYRASLILSLDGIIRVLGSEGKDSKTLNYFLNSLGLVGLENEKTQISNILFDKNFAVVEAQSVLQELRQSLEERIREKNRLQKIPQILQFSLPSPIELGI